MTDGRLATYTFDAFSHTDRKAKIRRSSACLSPTDY